MALRVRTLLDDCITATSLLYASWALVLGPVFRARAATRGCATVAAGRVGHPVAWLPSSPHAAATTLVAEAQPRPGAGAVAEHPLRPLPRADLNQPRPASHLFDDRGQ